MRELRHKEGKTLVKATQGTVAKKKEGDSSAGPSAFFFFCSILLPQELKETLSDFKWNPKFYP